MEKTGCQKCAEERDKEQAASFIEGVAVGAVVGTVIFAGFFFWWSGGLG
jgi:hypothetical protein